MHVSPFMLFHVSVLSKGPAAEITDERSLSCMNSHMVKEIPRLVEDLTAAIMSTFIVGPLSL